MYKVLILREESKFVRIKELKGDGEGRGRGRVSPGTQEQLIVSLIIIRRK